MNLSAPCVVFDIDDTLYLERDYVRSGFQAVGEHLRRFHGVDGVASRAWELFLDGHRATTFNVIVEEHGLPSELIHELVSCYRRHQPRIEPCADSAAAIARLRNATLLAVISDGPIESQRAKAEVLDVNKWSQSTILTSELGPGRSKPTPYAFLEVQHRLPGATWYAYVGDNPAKDFVAPQQLGWRTVRIRRPGSLHEHIDSGDDVDVEVVDLDQLEEALEFDDLEA